MSFYRITRFASSDMDKTAAMAETMRATLESAGAEFIDIVSYGNGKGVVLAKYPSEAAMEAASEIAKTAFGKMIEAGLIDAESLHPHVGEVIQSF